jgi:hypothetical protein
MSEGFQGKVVLWKKGSVSGQVLNANVVAVRCIGGGRGRTLDVDMRRGLWEIGTAEADANREEGRKGSGEWVLGQTITSTFAAPSVLDRWPVHLFEDYRTSMYPGLPDDVVISPAFEHIHYELDRCSVKLAGRTGVYIRAPRL